MLKPEDLPKTCPHCDNGIVVYKDENIQCLNCQGVIKGVAFVDFKKLAKKVEKKKAKMAAIREDIEKKLEEEKLFEENRRRERKSKQRRSLPFLFVAVTLMLVFFPFFLRK